MLKRVIFVHGAWVNERCWDPARAMLEELGFATKAVRLSLTALADDAAIVSQAIAAEDGPVVLAGHSYGGAVITQAGADTRVAGLVYINAFAPDVGESAHGLSQLITPACMKTQSHPGADGMLSLTRDSVRHTFAQDLSAAQQETIFQEQRPCVGLAPSSRATVAAWHYKPSWYLIATLDRALPPALQKILVYKIGAVSRVVAASHCSMISQPRAVADLVLQALQ